MSGAKSVKRTLCVYMAGQQCARQSFLGALGASDWIRVDSILFKGGGGLTAPGAVCGRGFGAPRGGERGGVEPETRKPHTPSRPQGVGGFQDSDLG